jgi:glycosyltransferase involved in cell wall biosynthesis
MPSKLASKCLLPGIRIARISTVPFFVVTQLKGQIETLGKSGATVMVVSSDGPELSALDGIFGVRCEPIEIQRSISPWQDMLSLLRLFFFFRREHIQIAHSTTPKAGLLTAVAAFLARVPVRLHTFTGQPWVVMHGIKRWFAYNSDKIIGKISTRCYADSGSQRQFLLDQLVVARNRLAVLGAGSIAGVDIHRFDSKRFSSQNRTALRNSLGIPDDAPVLLFVGRITVDKGVRELLKAFTKVKEILSDVHLVFVGQFDADSGVAGSVSQGEIKGVSSVHVIGYSDCPEAYMAIADVLCLPSYREGFGTVIIEAAAMGLPAIGTAIYGLSDAIVHGETGLLVERGNVEELAGAIRLLLSDRILLSEMATAAKQRAWSMFDADIVNALIVEEYVDLLREKKVFS